jgi:hypothetical protein
MPLLRTAVLSSEREYWTDTNSTDNVPPVELTMAYSAFDEYRIFPDDSVRNGQPTLPGFITSEFKKGLNI